MVMSDWPKLNSMRIVHYPENVLRQRAAPIPEPDSFVHELAERMNELMREAKGVGLAANQVGWPHRLVIVGVSGEEGRYQAFINPAIIARTGRLNEEEGCLSVPGVSARVRRAQHIVVEATTLAGERVRIEAQDLAARTWQHEIDHLDGLLFIDKIGPAARLVIRSRLRELERKGKSG
jgi:peptide deformylase